MGRGAKALFSTHPEEEYVSALLACWSIEPPTQLGIFITEPGELNVDLARFILAVLEECSDLANLRLAWIDRVHHHTVVTEKAWIIYSYGFHIFCIV